MAEKQRKKYPYSRLFVIVAFTGLIIINLVVQVPELQRIGSFKEHLPHQIIGYQFAELTKFTQGIEYIGYDTDFAKNNPEGDKYFSHAQYILAPTVLDYKNLKHEHILLVYKNPNAAIQKMKQLNAVPLRMNRYGMILAKRRSWK